jgi:hypothetical protein
MSEASKLFDKSGGAASGNKQDVVNGAAMTAVKLFVQSKAKSYIGGGNSGGVSGLMGLVSRFFLAMVFNRLTGDLGFEIYVKTLKTLNVHTMMLERNKWMTLYYIYLL